MFKPLTLVVVDLGLALSGATLAEEKTDPIFPVPVDGKLIMEITHVIK